MPSNRSLCREARCAWVATKPAAALASASQESHPPSTRPLSRPLPHATLECTNCHNELAGKKELPHPAKLTAVDCGACHGDEKQQYAESSHGRAARRGDAMAPRCTDCHGTHNILLPTDPGSPTGTTQILLLCGRCHHEGSPVQVAHNIPQDKILENYTESIHGEGLFRRGLIVTAVCTSCHTVHFVLPHTDPRSSISKQNIARTCTKCHALIENVHRKVIRGELWEKQPHLIPACVDCHEPHKIRRVFYAQGMSDQDCQRCHANPELKTASGGRRRSMFVNDQELSASRLSRANVVKTCGQCHPGSNRRFAGYLTHATHHDPKKYPILFLTFWAMTSLLMGTLVVAGMHTVAWLPRSLQYSRELKANANANGTAYVRRFRPFDRNLHLMVIASFLGLALTGMTLKFSYTRWAQVLSHLLGGFEAAGVIHRFCAVLTFTYFGLHLWDLLRQHRASGKTWRQFIFGPGSMVFNRRDGREFIASLKWFLGKGPRPEYGRWTYWEKFDYFAVLWGVAVIGTTGLLLWFPEFFTRLLPGWMINVATIIHSDEALLAVGFIFTVHLFNTHFRPERFPIDTVVFTGGEPLEKFKLDRPREYRELLERGELEKRLMPVPPPVVVEFWRRFGFTALTVGLGIIALIIYAAIFAYK